MIKEYIRLWFLYIQISWISSSLDNRLDRTIKRKIGMGEIDDSEQIMYAHECAKTALNWKFQTTNLEKRMVTTVQQNWWVNL
jgi:hypothetical protein